MRNMPRSHRLCMPRAQYEQRPQDGRKLRTTESPSATWLTLPPTLTTTPAPSWPPTTGNGIGMSPVTRCSSEWHSPLAVSLTRTSLSFGASSSTSSTCHFSFRPQSTAALVFIDCSSLSRTAVGQLLTAAGRGEGDPGDHDAGGLELAQRQRGFP